jgi:molybdate transport system substrate-binding protein
VLVAVALAGCGDSENGEPRLVVSAASSMTEALTACSPEFEGAEVRLSFAGSDELAAQIRQGVRPDVYAAANSTLPGQLAQEGLLGTPTEFATNELVLAVPRDSRIGSLDDLAQSDAKIAIGSESVPIGSYTRLTLAKLPAGDERKILSKVRSEEPDVKGIVGKLTQGSVDAGFVYVTDVTAAGDELRAIRLPRDIGPRVTYAAAVVKGAQHPRLARAYLGTFFDGACADALRAAGFGAAP